MKLLVVGGTGQVGSLVVEALLERNADVSVLTRDAGKSLPAGVKAVEGNLGEPATVRSVFKGYDGVFLINTVSPSEAHEGLMAVLGARLGGVKRIVYVSVQDADVAAHLPHFGAKVGIEEAVKRSGAEWTILRPNNFHQNDALFKDAMLQYGVYPQPLGNVGLSRVDIRDIADAAAVALTADGHAGETYNIVGPAVLTGEATAKTWSQALGKEIKYGGDDLDAWEQQFLQYMPDWLVFDFREMYAHFQKHGLKAGPDDLARQAKLIGHAPRSLEAYAQEMAAAWRS